MTANHEVLPQPPSADGADPPLFRPEHEVRVAVVLYGGVSLAIYMYGVVREVWSLVRATAPEHANGDQPNPGDQRCRHADSTLSGAEPVYRRLGRMLGRDNVDESVTASAPVRSRVVVDVVSGTSAGGINGIALAMALANETDFQQLARVWLETADINKLLSPDPPTGSNASPEPQRSLLNSTMMYRELLDALNALTRPQRTMSAHRSCLTDEIHLAVTTTDLLGLPSTIGLDRERVRETMHQAVFRFRYGTPYSTGEMLNDFTSEDVPFLAYAARCTSSFPLAFDPMQLDRVYSLLPQPPPQPDDDRWNRFYQPYITAAPPFRIRPFSDGGVLDNKPFSLATAALHHRRADLPVERRLVYVEPSPETSDAEDSDGPTETKLSVLKAAKLAAWDLRGRETIRADLDRVAERNARLRELDAVLGDVERRVSEPEQPSSAESIAYERLRVDLARDHLASVLRQGFQVDALSAEARALDALLDGWRQRCHSGAVSFLERFDVPYEIRRLAYLKQRLGVLTAASPSGASLRVARGVAEPTSAEEWTQLREQGSSLTAALGAASVALSAAMWRMQEPAYATELAQARNDAEGATRYGVLAARILDVKGVLDSHRSLFDELVAAPWDLQPTLAARLLDVPGILAECNALADALKQVLDAARLDAQKAEKPIWNVTSPVVSALRWHAEWFRMFDMLLVPLVFGSDIGETEPVQVARISPYDSRASGKGKETKLFGESVGHFGAFLREDWRRLDLVSGRLDGASRLIQMLLPADDRQSQGTSTQNAAPAESLADLLIREAHQAILTEEYGPGGVLYQLTDRFAPDGVDLRDAFWKLREATDTKLDRTEWIRHGNRAAPFLRAALREGLPWWGGRPASGLVATSWGVARGYFVAVEARDRVSEIAANARDQVAEGIDKLTRVPRNLLRLRRRSRTN